MNLSNHRYLKQSKSSSLILNPGKKLYQKAIESKIKKERFVEGIIEEERRSKTPKITQLAMMIHRDPSMAFNRLYPSHILKEIQKRKSKEKYFYELELEDPFTQRVYRRKQEKNKQNYFTFTPEIDRNSKKLVIDKGTFFKRLENLKKKKEKKLDDNLNERSISLNNINEYSLESPSKSSKSFFIKILKKLETDSESQKYKNKMNNIFNERAKILIRLKQNEQKIKNELFSANREEKQEEVKENFWKKYNKNQLELKKKYSPETFFKKQEIWKKNVERRKEKLKEIVYIRENEICTFKPELSSLDIKDDEVFINRNLNQIVEYVSKRKKCLENEKFSKEKVERKYISKERFVFKPTIPRAFILGKERNNTPMTNRGSIKNGGKIRNLTTEIHEFFCDPTL